MSNVIIIKNNDMKSEIYSYVQRSFLEKCKGYYNTLDNSPNERYLKKIGQSFKDGLILFITYDSKNNENIQDVYIGSDVVINANNNVEYFMKIHLTNKNDKRAIDSIIDKIDLDLSKDFELNCYVIMSNMDSLYKELLTRIVAREEQIVVSNGVREEKEMPYQLSVLAQKDIQTIRVFWSDEIGEYRTQFQRDRERVVNCKAFRRLVDKAQIFSAEKGDYFRTRMTHSLEVNQIAKAIAYALNLNLDLTEAIALGHDLGHTPFGHQGERTLDDILGGKIDVGLNVSKKMLTMRCFGGFKHNYQSARILTQLEEKYTESPGLNVSVQVIEGVLKHTRLKDNIDLKDFLPKGYIEKIKIADCGEKKVCATLEGQVVAIADEIAQRGHDVDDALTSGVMSIEEFIDRLKINKCSQLQNEIQKEIEKIDTSKRLLVDERELKIARIVSSIIHYMISSTIKYSKNKIKEYEKLGEITMANEIEIITFSPEVERINSYLERVVQKKVICNNEVAKADYNASMIVRTLFEKYYTNPRLLHEGTIRKIFIETLRHNNKSVSNSAINLDDGRIAIVNEEIKEMTKDEIREDILIAYLNGDDSKKTEKDVIVFEKRRILVRAITDFIAGMTDGYALEEYEKLK